MTEPRYIEIPNEIRIEDSQIGTQRISTAKWTPAFVAYLLTRGATENKNNASAGRGGTEAGRKAKLAKVAEMTAGIIPTSGPGAGIRLDPVEIQARIIVRKMLVDDGYKSADADKKIKAAGAAAAFRAEYGTKYKENTDKAWKMILDTASENAKRAAGPDLSDLISK